MAAYFGCTRTESGRSRVELGSVSVDEQAATASTAATKSKRLMNMGCLLLLAAVRGIVRAARECAVTQETRYDSTANALTSGRRQVTTLAPPVRGPYDG